MKKFLLYSLFLFFVVSTSCYSQQRKKINRIPQEQISKTNLNSNKQPSTKSRTTDSNKKKNVTKNVENNHFSISSSFANINSEGGVKQFTVSSNSDWTISTYTASWGHIAKSGNTLTLKVDRNTGGRSRKDYFIIKSGSKTIKVNIFQDQAKYLNISTENLNFTANGGTKTISVRSSQAWSIGTKTYSWGHLEVNGNTLTVKIDANATSNSRTDYFTIESGNITKKVKIFQGASSTTNIQTATINDVKVINNIDINGKKGLEVKVSFDISNMKEKDVIVACYFYDSDKHALINKNNEYGTNGSISHVAAHKYINPPYDSTTYTDLGISIPYNELHLSNNEIQNLIVDVIIWDNKSGTPKEIIRKEGTKFSCIPNASYLMIDGSASNINKHFGDSGGREYYRVSTSSSNYETWGVPSWCSIENKTSNGFTLVCNKNTSTTSRHDWMKVKTSSEEIRIDIEQDESTGPVATISSIEQTHNIFNGYTKGMNITIKFNVSGMRGRTIKATACFYYSDNITKLKNQYGGQPNVSRSDTAPYDETTFTMALFMPYQGLNMAPGWNGSLTFDVVIKDISGSILTRKNNNSFTYSQSSF